MKFPNVGQCVCKAICLSLVCLVFSRYAHADVTVLLDTDGSTVFFDTDDPNLTDPDPTFFGVGDDLSFDHSLSADGSGVVNLTGASLGLNSFSGNSTLNVSGGSVSNAFLDDQSTANISGGSVSNLEVFDLDGVGAPPMPNISISGGNISFSAFFFDTTDIVISGGSVSTPDVSLQGGSLDMSGGSLNATTLAVSGGGQVTFSGGMLEESLCLDAQGEGSAINLVGSDFMLVTSDTLGNEIHSCFGNHHRRSNRLRHFACWHVE